MYQLSTIQHVKHLFVFIMVWSIKLQFIFWLSYLTPSMVAIKYKLNCAEIIAYYYNFYNILHWSKSSQTRKQNVMKHTNVNIEVDIEVEKEGPVYWAMPAHNVWLFQLVTCSSTLKRKALPCNNSNHSECPPRLPCYHSPGGWKQDLLAVDKVLFSLGLQPCSVPVGVVTPVVTARAVCWDPLAPQKKQ